MADENIVTNIVANADFSGLIADVNKVAASLSKLQAQIIQSDARLASQVATMNRSFGENLRRTGQFSTHFVTLTSDVEKFGTNLDKGQMKLKQYFQTFQTHTKTQGGLIRDLAKQQVALQNAIIQPMGKNAQGLMQYSVHIPQGIDAVKNKTALARQELQIMNKVIQDGGVQMINWGKNTQWAGRQLTVGLTVPLAAFGKAAADAFRMADAELTRLTKVYGGIAATSATELSKIRNEVAATAKDISKSYGVSFKDTISLAADIAATGKQGNELLASVKETSRLAVLGEVDRQDAMKATLAIQNTFKQNTDQLSESINFLNAVENQTSTSLGDLIEAIPKAGPVIQGMGGSVKDLALYLTAMKEGGVNAAEGANALKSALASLINPTKVATEKFASMGIDLGGIVTKNAGNLTGTILELQKALDQLDPLKKQQAIEQLFGKFQFARMNALFSNLGKQGSQTLQVMDLMKASSQELAGVAGRELSMVTESASGKYRRALEGLKADLATMGEEFLKIQTFFVNVTDGILKFINKLPGPVKTILTFVTGLTAVIGPIIMLTGVLANFFGYIIKGASHFRSLFKGGEGWKMLTPEILAAQKAGSLVEATFYSDAKAATVLKTAIAGLVTEFELLQSKAMTGAVSVAPAMSTMAGNLVNGSNGRVVNPNHPLISPEDTRSMSHLNPVAGMTGDQKAAQTIFGVVPGAPKVNQKIGNNPQMYMSGDLPKIPGLTSIGGASTGIVAAEAAKWHAMTGALAMQSQAEITLLKKEVQATGLITTELSDSYQALLPTMTKLTANAATESAAIVAELQAGKITVDVARSKIIALNAQVESMIAQASVDIAGQQGRSIGLTTVPLLNQPVVNNAGKSNMKELLRPGRTRDLLNKIAGGLGVKTFGAGYSTETTIPKRMATGGVVYRQQGSSGPEFKPMGTDTVPAMLTEGEFVVNADAAKQNMPLLKAINNGATLMGANENVTVPRTSNLTNQEMRTAFPDRFSGNQSAYDVRGTSGIYLGEVRDPAILSKYPNFVENGKISRERINAMLAGRPGVPTEIYEAAMKASGHPHVGSTDQFLGSLAKSGVITASDATKLQNEIDITYRNAIRRLATVRDDMNPYHAASDRVIQKHLFNNPDALGFWNKFSSEPSYAVSRNLRSNGEPMRSPSMELRSISHNGKTINLDPLKATRAQGFFAHATTPQPLLQRLMAAGITATESRFVPRGWAAQRRRFSNGGPVYMAGGGIVPGYSSGGMVPSTQYFQDGSDGPVGFRAGFQSQTDKGYLGKGMMSRREGGGMGMGTQMGIMMGGSMAGQAMGGTAGNMTMLASNILPWLPFQKILPLLKSGEAGAGAFKNALMLAGKAAGLLVRLLPGAAIIGAIALAVKGYQAWQKQIAETRREHIMLNGITEKGAKELGIDYKNVSTSIKDVREQLKLQKDTTRAAFEAYASSGIPGLTLSIKQLKDLKQQVKTTMPEIISTFNSVDASKVNDLAINLKAQMISGGKSIEEATNTIYALISASDKAGLALGAISQSGFAQIIDKSSAAQFSINLLVKNLNNVSKIDPKAFASNIDSVIASLDNAILSLTGTKDSTGATITESKAIAIEFEKMAKSGALNKKLSADVLSSLQKERPELAAILNKADTIGSMYAKWRLTLQGTYLDLKSISAQQAIGLAAYQDALNAATNSAKTNTKSGVFKTSASELQTLNDRIIKNQKIIQNASNQTAGLDKQAIKNIQAKIKLINDEADAKKKALQATEDSANTELELQKLQLEAQSAIARGDKDALATINLSIEQLTKQAQTKAAIDKIEENRLKAIAAQQKILDDDQAKKDASTTNASKLGGTVATDQSSASAITSFQNRLGDLLVKQDIVNNMKSSTQAQKDAKSEQQKIIDEALFVVLKDLEKSNKDVQTAFSEYIENGKAKDLSTAKTIQMKRSGTVLNIPEGSARTTFNAQTSVISKEAEAAFKTMSTAITGGATLQMVVDAINGKLSAKTIDVKKDYGNIAYNKFNPLTYANTDNIASLIKNENLKQGDTFTYKGKEYTVDNTSGPIKTLKENKKALGGPVVAGQTYTVNDRINSLGIQQEGFSSFTPQISGMVYPNASTMPRYNIASGQVTGMRGGVNNSSSNSNYSINIALNGTNVTADDVVRRFKQEMALINAKEGRGRTVGGSL
jgi:TP901 family phage tail tape measure protein